MRLKWEDTLAVWWSYLWRAVLYGAASGVIAGSLAGAIAGATGHLDRAAQSGRIAGSIAGLVLSILAMHQALQKHVGRLIAVGNAAGVSSDPQS